MKIVLPLFILICGFFNLRSQNLDHSSHFFYDNPKQIVTINSRCFYLEEGSTRLIGLTGSGQISFTLGLPGYDRNGLVRLIKTKDNCLAVVGFGYGCETYNHQVDRNFIVKVDTNGNVKFQTLIQHFYSNYFILDRILDFTQHNDSSFYLVSDSLIYHYSKTGSFISRINSGFKSINSILALNNGNLLINGKLNNTLKILEVTPTLSVVNQQNISTGFYKLKQMPSGQIYALTAANELLKLNSNFSTSNSSTTTINQNYKINDFFERHDSLFLTGINVSSNTPFYFITDNNFNFLYTMPLSTYKNVVPTAIAIDNNNKVNIITRNLSTLPGRLASMTHYQFPLTGNFVSKSDIGVVGYSILYSYVIPQETYGMCYLKAVVKNYGFDTIKSFYLNYHGFTTFTCQKVSLHKLCNTIIPPNGSVEIETGQISFEIFPTLDICLFTTVPNLSTDVNVDNDTYCNKVGFTTEITEIEKENIFSMFPNPFSNSITLQSEFTITKIALYDNICNKIYEAPGNTKTLELNNSDLPRGIYFLKIETDKGSQMKKVIKQ